MSKISWEERKEFYTSAYFDGGMPGHYESWWWTDLKVWEPRAQLIRDTFDPKTVLDCGCAKGSLVKFLVDLGIDAYGFDLSEHAIETTPFPEVSERLFIVDFATEPLPLDKTFDLVCCFDFIEHNDDAHIGLVCDKIMNLTEKHILIRQPLVHLDLDVLDELHKRTRGLPLCERWHILEKEPSYSEWAPDESEIEHPNTLPRKAVVELFSSQFDEIVLPLDFYDFIFGEVPRLYPVCPFYDTIVLKRK
jgi:SAM-dependent methyltransferase